jgi:hypothetical protein
MVSSYTARYLERCQAHGRQHVLLDDQVFTKSGAIIGPSGPASQGSDLNRQQCHALLKTFGGGVVRYTDGFRADNRSGEWYSVVSRKFTPLDDLPHKRRYQIKGSLRHCEARLISADELASNGYRVFLQAIKRYKGTRIPVPTAEEFKQNVAREAQFPDIVDHWGLFFKNILIGYSQNLLIGNVEAYYSTTKLDPEYFKYDPGYALIYRMNEHYLGRRGFQYVNDGFRSVYHETNVQSFLIENFGFEKAYTKLHLYYRPPLGVLMRLGYPSRAILGRIDRRLAALFEQERCRRFS